MCHIASYQHCTCTRNSWHELTEPFFNVELIVVIIYELSIIYVGITSASVRVNFGR